MAIRKTDPMVPFSLFAGEVIHFHGLPFYLCGRADLMGSRENAKAAADAMNKAIAAQHEERAVKVPPDVVKALMKARERKRG